MRTVPVDVDIEGLSLNPPAAPRCTVWLCSGLNAGPFSSRIPGIKPQYREKKIMIERTVKIIRFRLKNRT